jgi:hypothetical protein
MFVRLEQEMNSEGKMKCTATKGDRTTGVLRGAESTINVDGAIQFDLKFFDRVLSEMAAVERCMAHLAKADFDACNGLKHQNVVALNRYKVKAIKRSD